MKMYVAVKKVVNRWMVILVWCDGEDITDVECLGYSDNEDDAYSFAIEWEATL